MNSDLSPANYSFEWLLDQTTIAGATTNTYEALQAGLYSVVATNLATSCISQPISALVTGIYRADSFIATTSEPFSDQTSIVVTVPQGTGPFQYQIDQGAFQSSNEFLGITGGTHTIHVISDRFCTNLSQDVFILNYPHYFTPNGDGFNDTWNIWDLKNQYNSRVFIFDRYGKFIKEISPLGSGWDGNYNTYELPSTDYWFTVDYLDGTTQKVFKSHFTLKR